MNILLDLFKSKIVISVHALMGLKNQLSPVSIVQEKSALKVLISEKRGGLKVVAFDRSPFKLFTLRFSNKSVQAPSCEKTETSQRTLFLAFEINNCLPITV